MTISRRRALQLGAGLVGAAACPRLGHASTYPERPITLVVPVAAGGGVDAFARILAEFLREKLRQPAIVENRPGAGSVVGASSVAKAAPDGYTLLLMEPAALVAKWLNRNVTYDVTADFAPVALMAAQPLVLFAHPSVPASGLGELIAHCRAHPRSLAVGTAGVGSPHHLAAAWLNTAAGIDIVHQPYRGAGPALNDLLGGHVPLIWALPAPVMPFLADGRVKALAVSMQQRFALLPAVPTVAETAVPDFDLDFFYGVAAPAGTPPDIIRHLSDALAAVAQEPAFVSRMTAMGTKVDFRPGPAFGAFVAAKSARYGSIVSGAGIKVE